MNHPSTAISTVLLALTLVDGTSAFGVASHRQRHRIVSPLLYTRSIRLSAAGKKEEEGGVSKSMEEAFKQLEELKSLGGGVDDNRPERKKQKDDAFAKAMQELDLKDIQEVEPVPAESEVELYKDMAAEIDGKTDFDLIADVTSEMGGSPAMFPKFDPTVRNTEKFMEKALDEALEEAGKKAKTAIDKESVLDNKEIMKEIEAIFDKANSQLLEGLEDIRKEQMALAKESAERNSKKSQDRINDEQERLAMAEANMRKYLDKVNTETKAVESAIDDLKQAQKDMEGGVDDQLSSLKSAGIVKQATLIGTFLFSLRSFVEGVAYMGGDTTHLMPAVIQGAIAVVCLIAFIFL